MPDSADTGKPDEHNDTSEVNWEGDAIILGTENLNREINEKGWDEISGDANTGENKLMNGVKGGTAVTKPSNDEENGEGDH